jgi:DNA-binding Lrp family transcriptional regulator
MDGLSTMKSEHRADAVDLALLRVLIDNPRAATVTVAEEAGVARNTVHARFKRWDDAGVLHCFDLRINPRALGLRDLVVCTAPIERALCRRARPAAYPVRSPLR